jgi:uridine phosphorylase
MLSRIAESELIINQRGGIYHLNLRPEELADTIITVGDPDRVKEVSKHFDTIDHRSKHREFITHTGSIGAKRISVISTGIGPDNIDIVINELDALVNIDLLTRQVKDKLTSLRIIRVGTSGALQGDIPVDAFVASTHGIGMDNLMHFYRTETNEEERQLLHSFVTQTQLHNHLSHPYIFGGSPSLLKIFTQNTFHGITVTCPGFYGPQGRVLRMGLSLPHLNDSLTRFSFGQHRITNFEMETAAIYGLGKSLGRHYQAGINYENQAICDENLLKSAQILNMPLKKGKTDLILL